jgi:aminopeptidase-like protein
LPHDDLLALEQDTYEVCIDSTLIDGHLTYCEPFLKGESDDEVLISCHSCHPSLCNDNLSGIATAATWRKTLWMLNLSDEQHTLLDIADRAKLEFAAIRRAASLLESSGLLRPAPPESLWNFGINPEIRAKTETSISR